MDQLLVDIAGVTSALDQSLESYSVGTSSTVFLIKAQIRLLENAVEEYRRWLFLAHAMTMAQASRRLHNTVAIVKAAIARLRCDIESIRHNSITASEKPSKCPDESSDENGMRLHLCDISECVFLVKLLLQTYVSWNTTDTGIHWPVPPERLTRSSSHQDEPADGEPDEFEVAISILRGAHTTRRCDRRMIMEDSLSANRKQFSTHFNDFIESVFSAEDDLMRQTRHGPADDFEQMNYSASSSASSTLLASAKRADESKAGSPSSLLSNTTPIASNTAGQDQSIYTTSRRTSQSSLLTTDTRWSRTAALTEDGISTMGTATPLTHTQSYQSPRLSQRLVSRKPVRGSTVPMATSSSMSVPRASTMADIRQRDALLAVASPLPSTAPHNRTRRLFHEASGSLTSLTDGLSTTGPEHDLESPPPYQSTRGSVRGSYRGSMLDTDTKQSGTERPLPANSATQDVFRAIRENRMETLQILTERGARVDQIDTSSQRTPLMEASALNREEAVQILLGAGVRAHLKDLNGWTALHFAALQGSVRICALLLDAGAQLDEYSVNGETPLQLAARGGHTEAVICLVNGWADQRGNRQTLLRAFCEACKCGNVGTAQAFVDNGVTPKNISESWTPVLCAAETGSIPMLDFMLARGCSLKDKSPEGWTALHFAARHGHTSMVEKLLALKVSWRAVTKRTRETALHLAVIYGHNLAALTLASHKDANVCVKDADGQQPLHHAVRNSDLPLTNALLGRGARLDDANSFGWQPIHIAAAYGHLALVADFLTRGASTDAKLVTSSFKPGKKTNEAARRGFWAEIRWPHAGSRPLHLALEFGHDEVANLLIASGARSDAIDAHFWRPLHNAAFNCRPVMVDVLLAAGASPHATTEDNSTPLSLGFRRTGLAATSEDKKQVVDLLQIAMDTKKKSKVQAIANFVTPPNHNARTAEARNRAWHTAELAAALYKDYDADTGFDEEDSQMAFSDNSYQHAGLEGHDHGD